jgi:hypothetical protein
MTPQDHNRTLGLIHGLIGVLAFVGVIAATVLAVRKGAASEFHSAFPEALYVLPIPLLQLLLGYGLLRRKRWARILALLFSVLYVWIFPLGTALAIYTWWFLHSAGGKRLYVMT